MSENKKTIVLNVQVSVYTTNLSTAAAIVETRLAGGHASPLNDPDSVQVASIEAKVQPRSR